MVLKFFGPPFFVNFRHKKFYAHTIRILDFALSDKSRGARDAAQSVAKSIGQKAADKLIKPSQAADQSKQVDLDNPNSGLEHAPKAPGS